MTRLQALEAWDELLSYLKWERLLNDETKTANFNRWADRVMAGAPSEPMDFDRL